jgi:gamma-glutamyl-gamma-aminobutyrate hydrolase PuuD
MKNKLSNRVYIVNPDMDYVKMFKDQGWEVADSIFDADLVQFTGGEDVSPGLYGQERHPKTYANPIRDKYEKEFFETALELGLPMAGICRGGQFLNVMNKGSMYQHVNNHGKEHQAKIPGVQGDLLVSSTHHQMMIPSVYEDHIVLLIANESTTKEFMNSTSLIRANASPRTEAKTSEDVEAIYYPKTHCLCFQPHPEYRGYKQCKDLYFYFLNNYVMNNVRNKNEIVQDILTNDIIPE